MKVGRALALLLVVTLAIATASIVPAAAAVSSGGKAAKGQKNSFVAPVEGTDAFIGIVLGKETAVAYFCDGADFDVWLTGAASGGVLALESQSGGALVARRSGNNVRGTLVLPNDETFEFEAVKAKGKAGVFRKGETVDGVTLAETWIRLADGQIRGGAGINEGITNLEPLVDEVIAESPEIPVQEAVEQVVTDLAEEAGLEPPPPLPPPVEITSPPVTAPPRDDGLPQIFFEDCFFINGTSIKNECIGIPRFLLPRRPPADAVAPEPPPLEETIAGAPAEVPPEEDPTVVDPGVEEPATPALGPTEVPRPAEDAFDEEDCSRIDRGLVFLADELDALDPEELESTVFSSVLSHLRDRGELGGCEGLFEIPA